MNAKKKVLYIDRVINTRQSKYTVATTKKSLLLGIAALAAQKMSVAQSACV